ncbi:MAG: flagellar motor protein MotB [Deltaproteobacteria bacterium]|nr:flagellar motor protein MotB [Deltaproteobacteria bacterium]
MARKDKNILYVKMPDRMGWMVTFSDMTTLLLCFFVMIISMSSMDAKALQNSFRYFSSVNGPLEYPREHEAGVPPLAKEPLSVALPLSVENLDKSLRLSLSKVTISALPGRGTTPFEVKETPRGYALVVPGDVLFDSGSRVIRKDALPLLKAIADVIRGQDSSISIEGNTDSLGNEEINWRLSLQRAIGILEYFEYAEGLSSSRFCVAGYGSMRPIAANDTEEGRTKNRRVEIILLKDRL